MSKLICNCPKCKSSLQFNVADQPMLKITCPKCQAQFQVRVPRQPTTAESPRQTRNDASPGTATQQPRDRLPSDLFASDPLATLNRSTPLAGSGRKFASQSFGKREKKSSIKSRKLLTAAAIASVALSVVALLAVGVMWGKSFLPKGATPEDLSSVLTSNLFGSDSRESIQADLQALRTQIELVGRSISDGDQSETSAKRLLAELPKFDSLFRRACKLPIKAASLEEFASEQAKKRELLERLRSQSPSDPPSTPTDLPFQATFWRVNTAAKPEELVTHAVNEVTLASNSVSTIMSQAMIEYPDPLTYQGTEFDWSAEDRRVLAIIRLQGSVDRDALRAFAAIDPKATSTNDLREVHLVIDQAVQSAKELSKIPGKSVGGMLAFVPKGNPYEPHQISAMVGLDNLRKLMEAEAMLPVEVNYLLDDVKALSETIEAMIYGSGSLATYMASAPTSSERFKAFVAASEKQKQDEIQAEADRKAKEQQQLADAKLREQKAAEEQRKQMEERQRASDERQAQARSGKSGGRLGMVGPGGTNESIGPRPGPMGVPTGPGGVPFGANGANQQPGQPPNFPGLGARPPEMGQDRYRPPAPPQGDPAKLVTITCAQVRNQDSSIYLRDLPKWVLQYSPSILISNGSLKITVQNYDKPLADLAPCFPTLEFESVNTESRTIVAKEK